MAKQEQRQPQISPYESNSAVEGAAALAGPHDLSRLLSATPAPPALVVPTFLSVISAVDASHREHNEPCELDPRKVLFRSDGTLQVERRGQPAAGMTVVLSSSKYASPEMVEGAISDFDSSVLDSYVLGFVFYEILLGRDRFHEQFAEVARHGELGWLTWHADKSMRLEPLSSVLDGFPSLLSQLISEMTTKESAERITDLGSIADTIAGSQQATSVLTGLSAFRKEESSSAAPQKPLPHDEIAGVWRRTLVHLLRGVRKVLRKHDAKTEATLAKVKRVSPSRNARRGNKLK